ncbi:MAG: iron-sulfur cluster assembly scaffold protein [Candidatus Hermodarchaeota archaeon]
MSKEQFDKFADDLQKEIIKEELKIYNEQILALFHNPENWGKLLHEETSIMHSYKGSCGDTMEFYLKIGNNIIEKIKFITDGCGASVATGSQTTILLKGKSLEFAENLKAIDIDSALHGLPEDHKHCAELAARTIKQAIEKYKALKKE